MTITDLNTRHKQDKEHTLFGRYISLNDIAPLIDKLPSNFITEIIGRSVLDQKIYSI